MDFRLLCCGPSAIVQRVKKLLLITATVFMLSLSAFAANVTGTWNAKVDLGSQTGSPTFVLKQDGEKLTGTYSGALGDAPLTGTIKDNKISFDFTVQDNNIHYEGTVNTDGTQMEGTCDYGGQASGTFKATKAEIKPSK
jgi:hypothetical protein